jgi:hypothetical protein
MRRRPPLAVTLALFDVVDHALEIHNDHRLVADDPGIVPET